jgi:hypothetical protein
MLQTRKSTRVTYDKKVSSFASHRQHCKNSFSIFPFPAGMLLTKLSLGGNNDVIYKLLPPRESLVSDIPAGDGNIEKLFYSVQEQTTKEHDGIGP